ncbi:hypothetical protein K440DRAFT_273591 [Wilcoxina mikolae CBS 423.85]|nr:hypothetical protein K440DRAFT_273591 [Wilcoxina mikolae CBS 423.85]
MVTALVLNKRRRQGRPQSNLCAALTTTKPVSEFHRTKRLKQQCRRCASRARNLGFNQRHKIPLPAVGQ